MNTPNPLMPQGSLPQSKKSSTVRIAVFSVIAIHAVFFTGLLMQGCKREDAQSRSDTTAVEPSNNTLSDLPPLDTNFYSSIQEIPPASTSTPAATGGTPTNLNAYDYGYNQSPATTSGATSSLPPLTASPAYPPAVTTAPAASGESREYTIVRGDTLSKIASTHGVTLSAIMKANPGLDSRRLKIGKKIQIPVGSSASSSSPMSTGSTQFSSGKTGTSTGNGNTHVVKSGETLTKIARQHGVTINALRNANNLRTDRLMVGQKLKVPSASSTSSNQTGLTGANPF